MCLKSNDSRFVAPISRVMVESIPTISLWLIHPNWISTFYFFGFFDAKSTVKWSKHKEVVFLYGLAAPMFSPSTYMDSMNLWPSRGEKWYGCLVVFPTSTIYVYYTLDSLDDFQRWPHISTPNVDRMFLSFVVFGGPPPIEEPIRFTFSQLTRWNRHLHVRDRVQKERSLVDDLEHRPAKEPLLQCFCN